MRMKFHEIPRTNMFLQELQDRHSAMRQDPIVGNDRHINQRESLRIECLRQRRVCSDHSTSE